MTVNELKSCPDISTTVQNPHINTLSTTLTLNDFHQSATQITEKNTLCDHLFSYIYQKFILDYQPGLYPAITTLSEFRSFLDENSTQSLQQPSQVYYMELVNEYPDCAETMSLVAEDLLNKFGDVQEGWVILVGDGKSYRHLMAIKKQYSTALTKLLLFPGDWHILNQF